MKTCTTIIILAFCLTSLLAQKHSDEQTIEISLNNIEQIGLYNHRGDVKVTGTNSTQAVLKYTRRLKSASDRKLAEAKEEINLVTEKDGNTLLIFVEAPDLKFQISAEGEAGYRSPNWNDWNDRYRVSWEFDIELEIPSSMQLDVSNHHSGLEVRGVTGTLRANNHHRDLTIENCGSKVKAHTHHGDLIVTHQINPNSDCSYHTHHGDIRVSYQSGLSASAAMDTHHGSLYSDFEWSYDALQVSTTKGSKGTRYKIGKNTSIKIGEGGPKLDFDTHHGSIYLNRI